jgi:ubiquinone/menaquinone biosynthesis C-methylase UbiE
MKRVVVPELLDTDSGTPAEISDSLADLRWINKTFGGVTTTANLLRRVAHRVGLQKLNPLDVAGASGDVVIGAQRRLQEEDIQLTATVLDRAMGHLQGNRGTVAVAGDALQLPFKDNSFDVVGCALFVHHLDPDGIVRFVNEALRVCRHACIINDLRRSRLHLLSVQAGRPLYRSPITSHDSAASVRRAYTRDELEQILKRTSAESMDISEHFLFRMGAIAWKQAAG